MDSLYYGQINIVLIFLTVILAVLFLRHGYKNFRKGITFTDNPMTTLWTIRGIRGFILFIAMICFTGGLYFKTDWLLYFGLAFIAEEILETGVMALAARKQIKG